MIHRWRMRARLQSYCDGELPAARRAALAAHLEQCRGCAAAARRDSQTDRLLAAIRPTPPHLDPAASRALLARALAEAGVSPGGPGRGFPLLAWGLGAALILIASGAAAWWSLAPAGPPRASERARGGPGIEMAQSVPHGVLPVGVGKRQRDAAGQTRKPPPKRRPPLKKAAPGREGGALEAPKPPTPSPIPRLRQPARPRLRLAEASGSSRDVLPTAEWWREGAKIIEASERCANELAEALVVSAALTCVIDAEPSGTPSLPEGWPPGPWWEWGSGGTQVADGSSGEDLLERAAPVSLAETPLLGETLPWLVAEAGMAPAADRAALLVVVASEPAPSPILVTEAPETVPGYARCSTVLPEAEGRATWSQATVASGEEVKLALLGLAGSLPW